MRTKTAIEHWHRDEEQYNQKLLKCLIWKQLIGYLESSQTTFTAAVSASWIGAAVSSQLMPQCKAIVGDSAIFFC